MAKILVIEDEEGIRTEVVEWLQFEGHEALGAENGKIGLEVAFREHPDLILCDISMPEMDGYGVLLAIRESLETRLTPFIFMTARTDRVFVRHGMELGADDYVTKPFTRPELLSALKARLERQASLVENYSRALDDAERSLARLVTHELKTPVVSIQFVREIIDRQINTLPPEELRELLRTLLAGTDRLHHMVEQLVYWVNIEAGVLSSETVKESPTVNHVEQLLLGAVSLARRFAWRNQTSNISPRCYDGQAGIQGPPEPLRHAIAELIANAQNFSDENVLVSLSQWVSGDTIVISLLDEGKGMSTEQQAKALAPFGQVDREQNEQQGLGLGLNVASRIIAIYGGQIAVKSVESKGTQIEITLPMVQQSWVK